MSDDQVPDPLAELDQALAAMSTMAKARRTYFNALTAEGFSEQQALELTTAWQHTTISKGS